MKRVLSFILVIVLLCSMSSCSTKYISSYRATVFIRHSWDGVVTADIGSFSGRYVWRLHNPNTSDSDICYEASISSGTMHIYYDSTTSGAGKQELFNISGNGNADGRGGYVGAGGEVYIILESEGDEPLRDVSLYISFKEN